ncbi:MAG TPA: hypothetical protein VI548_03390, partial [Chitinophagaceae bacterium]|nr:hypothetical protein [Chitinophagaceae bacterium]
FMNISKNLSWKGSIIGAYNRNRITDLFVINYNPNVLANGGSGAYVVGADANSVWRYNYAGVVNGIPSIFGPGKNKFNFYSFPGGNGVEYMQNMGTSIAPYDLNLMSSFQYKGLDLSFIVTSKFGHVFQTMGFNYPALFAGRVLPNNRLGEVMNGDPSRIAPLPPQTASSALYSWETGTARKVDYLVESASHVRMQEINLTYTIPPRIIAKTGFNRLRVYAQGNNLFKIVANKAGEDPEYPMDRFNNTTGRPMPRFTFGLRFDY